MTKIASGPDLMLIDLQRSLLLIVDMQERLLPALSGGGVALARAEFLIRAAKGMGSPILVSEHYADGIGRTSQTLMDMLPAECFMQKIHFSCLDSLLQMQRPAAIRRISISLLNACAPQES